MRTSAPWIIALVAPSLLGGCSGGGPTGTSPADAGLDAPVDAGPDAPVDAGLDAPVDADCGGLAWKTPACASCTHEACCSIERLCVVIPSCAPLNACWSACDGDAGCTQGCGTQYIGAISSYNAILNCQSNFCATACSQ
jgi:hypothetical protein